MSERVLWLFLWTTLAFWAGCSQSKPAHDADADATAAEAEYRQQIKGEAAAEAKAEPNGASSVAAAAPVSDDAIGAPAIPAVTDAPEIGASVVGLNRDNWKPTPIAPVSGAVPHHPQYFRTGHYRLVPDRPNPLASASLEAQADAVTAGARAPFDAADVATIGTSAVKGAFDLVAVPVKVVLMPPWTIHYSPSTAP